MQEKKRFNTNLYIHKKRIFSFVHSLNRTYDSCCNIYNPIKLMHVYWVAKKQNEKEKKKKGKKEIFFISE